MLFCRLLIFFKINFFKNLHSVGPDLGPNCLDRLSADDTSRLRVNVCIMLILWSYYLIEVFQGMASDFIQVCGPKWPMEQNMVGHFLKWWAQAYQTNHSWHLSSILYVHTDTDTCMRVCILTADYTVKLVLSGHIKKKTNYYLMQVKSILQFFWPSLSYHLSLRSLFCLFWVVV